jgi:hypothetical protein
MKIPILFGAVVALLGAVIYLYMQLDHVKKDLAANNVATQAQLDKLVEAASLNTRTNSRRVDELPGVRPPWLPARPKKKP